MRYIMRRICLFLVMIAVIVFTGCGQKKNEDPVTVTLWHVYGGQTESPLNDLIDEFNETIGKEKNIRVQVGSVTNTNTIHENVLASAFGDGYTGHIGFPESTGGKQQPGVVSGT